MELPGSQCFIALSQRQILELKEFADNNFKLDENGRVPQEGRKRFWKRRNCLLIAISPFPTMFSKDLYCRLVRTRACLGKG